MSISQRLVEIRESHGYTRKRLAQELNRPYTTVTKYESGEREPGHAYVIEVAKKFGVSTDYILGMSAQSSPSQANQSKLPDDAMRMAAAYTRATDKERNVINLLLSDYMQPSAMLRLAASTGVDLEATGIDKEDFSRDSHADIPL